MKISWQWLQDFVGLKAEADTVGEKLTLHTAELEEIINVADDFAQVYVGQLKSHTKLGEKLHVGQFDLGSLGTKQIVFGALHPLLDGEIVPVALAGAELASGLKIENTEIQGEASEGMVCDNRELGFKNEGLFRFSETSLVGKPLVEAVPVLQDVLFDIDNKSLTHRPDLMGHRGFAREIATIFGENLRLPEPVVSVPDSTPFSVDIKTKGCRRFCALPLQNITVEESPVNRVCRLEQLGTKSVSNMVDITNWVMLEFGQPMHVFDADKIEGSITIRQAKDGETLLALDGNEYQLSAEDMVVADENKALSIAGVMGGLESSVTRSTKNILFEAANWDPVQIRKTAQRLGIRTESSMRYEKSLAPEKCLRAVLAAAEMALEDCPKAKISGGLTDVFPQPQKPVVVTLDPLKVQQMAGVEIAETFMTDTLYRLGFKVETGKNPWRVTIPFFRSTKDVAIWEDLAEEIIRMHGFENIPNQLPTLPTTPPARNYLRELEWHTRDWWQANGALELVNYSFVKEEDGHVTGETDYVEIENPLSDEYQYLRRSLVSNALKHLESELRTHGDLLFYELGRTYHPVGETLPQEQSELLLLQATMNAKQENQQFYALKQQTLLYLQAMGIAKVNTKVAETTKPYQHPAKSAQLMVGDVLLGTISVIHPQHLPCKGASVCVAELDMKAIEAQRATEASEYQKLNPLPSVHRDLSIVLPEKTLMSAVVQVAQKSATLLESMTLFDEYRDEQKLGKGLKNLAFHLSFRSREQTLTDELVESDFASILTALKAELGAQLRLEFDSAKQQ